MKPSLAQKVAAISNPETADKERASALVELARAEICLIINQDSEEGKLDLASVSNGGEEFVIAYVDEVEHARGKHAKFQRVLLPGTEAASLLASQGLGLAVLGDGLDEAALISAEQLQWMTVTFQKGATSFHNRPTGFAPASEELRELASPLTDVLAGIAQEAYLVTASQSIDTAHPMIAVLGKGSAPNDLIAQALNEAVSLAALDANEVLIGFFSLNEASADEIRKVGVKLDLSKKPSGPATPGNDPAKPPKLI